MEHRQRSGSGSGTLVRRSQRRWQAFGGGGGSWYGGLSPRQESSAATNRRGCLSGMDDAEPNGL
jgi:hypothetical protein